MASLALTATSIDELKPSPLNPRKHFNQAEMADLQANIAKHGVILPIVCRQQKNYFEILDGERRWRAAVAAKAETVPIVLRDMTDADAIEFMLLNQIQRQDLTPLEEAHGFKALIDSNKSKYSAAYIGDRIGRTERWVRDRMQLLALVPTAKKLLEADRILVGHAEILAKLKPEDQERAIDPDGDALFEGMNHMLELDGPAAKQAEKDPYHGMKPVTVKELEAWVAEHVRFDVQHMATTAPLDFGPTKAAVDHANAKDGRGRKVISITREYRVSDDAKDPNERTYGEQSWERADGKEKSKTCDFSVLGVFVAGPGYGTSLQVCINKDKCKVHWPEQVAARERSAKLRAAGETKKADKTDLKAAAKEVDSWHKKEQARQAKRQAWEKLDARLEADAINQVKGAKTLTPAQVKFIENDVDGGSLDFDRCRKAGVVWHKQPAAAFLITAVTTYYNWNDPSFDDYVKKLAKPLGLDIKRLEAIRDKHQPKNETAAPAKAAKKAKKP